MNSVPQLPLLRKTTAKENVRGIAWEKTARPEALDRLARRYGQPRRELDLPTDKKDRPQWSETIARFLQLVKQSEATATE